MLTENPTFTFNNGSLWFGTAVAGLMPQSFDSDVAEIETLKLTLSPEYVEHQSKSGSVRLKTLKVMVGCAATGQMVTSQSGAALLKKWLYASQTTITGGAISATAFDKASSVAVGDILPLPGGKTKVSSLIITDSTGSPKTLTLGTNYEADVDAGVVKFLDVTTGGAYVQPFKAAFTEAAATANNLFQSTTALQGLRFKGTNLANGGAIEILDLPKIMISPSADWVMLGEGNEPNKYQWDFEVLSDASNLVYPFGRHKI